MNKSELRQTYLSKRKALPPPDREARSLAISALFFEKFDLSRIKYLHSFLPIEKFNEIDTWLIVRDVWRNYPHIQVLVPRVEARTNELSSLVLSPDTELIRNSWQIDEPAHDEFVEPELIDMVLVPGLCFDRRGHRVGYGKGYYDRFLSRCRPDCVKIGLSQFDPVSQIDDVHAGDVRLNFVITPRLAITIPE